MASAVTMTEAARRLGITRVTLRRLVREGVLPTTENPLDKRQKLIPESALKTLQSAPGSTRPRFLSDSAGSNPDVQSGDLEEYLEVHWRPR